MSNYVFFNLSDEALEELQRAVWAERDRRWKPKHPALPDCQVKGGAVEGIKAYREAYNLSVYDAKMHYDFHHKKGE